MIRMTDHDYRWKTQHHFHFMRDHPAHFIEVWTRENNQSNNIQFWILHIHVFGMDMLLFDHSEQSCSLYWGPEKRRNNYGCLQGGTKIFWLILISILLHARPFCSLYWGAHCARDKTIKIFFCKGAKIFVGPVNVSKSACEKTFAWTEYLSLNNEIFQRAF